MIQPLGHGLPFCQNATMAKSQIDTFYRKFCLAIMPFPSRLLALMCHYSTIGTWIAILLFTSVLLYPISVNVIRSNCGVTDFGYSFLIKLSGGLVKLNKSTSIELILFHQLCPEISQSFLLFTSNINIRLFQKICNITGPDMSSCNTDILGHALQRQVN